MRISSIRGKAAKEKYRDNISLPVWNWHALRHTFATNLIRQTHNMGEIKEAAEIIGDNYEVIMRTYVHTDSERKVSLIDAMIA